MKEKIEEATKYLETGGIVEVVGLTDMAIHAGHPKVATETIESPNPRKP